jgi:hypothetical protein
MGVTFEMLENARDQNNPHRHYSGEHRYKEVPFKLDSHH